MTVKKKKWSVVQSCNSTYRSVGDVCSDKRMRRRCEVETPTCPELGEKLVISEVKKMTVTDVIVQNIVMDSGTARMSDSIVMGSETARVSDGRTDQGVM